MIFTRDEFFREVAARILSDLTHACVLVITFGIPARDGERYEDTQQLGLNIGVSDDKLVGYLMIERTRPPESPFDSIHIESKMLDLIGNFYNIDTITIVVNNSHEVVTLHHYKTFDGRDLTVRLSINNELISVSMTTK